MNDGISSYELTEFNLKGQIKLSGKSGPLKLLRAQDNKLTLLTDFKVGLLNQEIPTPSRIGNVDDALAFVIDIGIRREKELTFANGLYLGNKLIQSQSTREVTQTDYNAQLMDDLEARIQGAYQSNEPAKETWAVKMTHLLKAYNNARLLFPNFLSESYLSLMRILDALFQYDALGSRIGAREYALRVALVSPEFNGVVYEKIAAIEGYKDRIKAAEETFDKSLEAAAKEKLEDTKNAMLSLNVQDKLIFACFYSAYQYRNKFIHWGLPFPFTVGENWSSEDDNGTNYLHPSLGISFNKMFRPEGWQKSDAIDFHSILRTEDDQNDFKNRHFLLLPTWHFLKLMTRVALKGAIMRDPAQP